MDTRAKAREARLALIERMNGEPGRIDAARAAICVRMSHYWVSSFELPSWGRVCRTCGRVTSFY